VVWNRNEPFSSKNPMSIICLHIPDYPAWALRRHYQVSDPIIVVEKKMVISLSRELNGSEIAIGNHIERAKALEPNAVCFKRDRILEAVVLEDMVKNLYCMTPQIAPVRNNIFLGCWLLLQNADMDLMMDYTKKIDAQVGVSHTRLYAMLSALTAPVGHMVSTPFHKVNYFLDRSPVTLLASFGFSKEIIEKLMLFGLRTVRDVARLKIRHLSAQFGTEGARLFYFLHPDHEPPVSNYIWDVLESTYTFETPVSEPRDTLPVMSHLFNDLTNRLCDRMAMRLEIRVLCASDTIPKGYSRILKKPTKDLEILSRIGETLLDKLVTSKMNITRISVIFGGLTSYEPEQQNLFFERPALDELFQIMHERFPDQLVRAALTGVDSTFPDDEMHLIPVDTNHNV
jgi:hypothetical protein